MKGAYLEVLSDAVGLIGVIMGAAIIYFTGWMWVDTLIAVLIGLWVCQDPGFAQTKYQHSAGRMSGRIDIEQLRNEL